MGRKENKSSYSSTGLELQTHNLSVGGSSPSTSTTFGDTMKAIVLKNLKDSKTGEVISIEVSDEQLEFIDALAKRARERGHELAKIFKEGE